jgi:hypothetical protein
VSIISPKISSIPGWRLPRVLTRINVDSSRDLRAAPEFTNWQKARPHRAFWPVHHAKSATHTSGEIRDLTTQNSRPSPGIESAHLQGLESSCFCYLLKLCEVGMPHYELFCRDCKKAFLKILTIARHEKEKIPVRTVAARTSSNAGPPSP